MCVFMNTHLSVAKQRVRGRASMHRGLKEEEVAGRGYRAVTRYYIMIFSESR